MSERQTPETDSLWYRDATGVEVVKRKQAARLERQRDELAEALREARKYIYYRGLGTDDVTVYGDNPPFIEAILDPIDALLARIEGKS